MRVLQPLTGGHHGLHLVDRRHLGQGEQEAVVEAALANQLAEEQVEGAQAASPGGRLERLEPDPVERRGLPVVHGPGQGAGGGERGDVLLGVRAVAEAVLEVDPQVLDRLGLELPTYQGVDDRGDLDRHTRRVGELLRRPPCASSAASASRPQSVTVVSV